MWSSIKFYLYIYYLIKTAIDLLNLIHCWENTLNQYYCWICLYFLKEEKETLSVKMLILFGSALTCEQIYTNLNNITKNMRIFVHT